MKKSETKFFTVWRQPGEVETSSKNLNLARVQHTKETLHIKYERKPVDIGFEYQRKEAWKAPFEIRFSFIESLIGAELSALINQTSLYSLQHCGRSIASSTRGHWFDSCQVLGYPFSFIGAR